MDKITIKRIMHEISLIDEMILASKPLLEIAKNREPDYGEKCGIAYNMHSFYYGIEKILLLLLISEDKLTVDESKWHKTILAKSFEKTDSRDPIFRDELREPLKDYLNFRHVSRNSYGSVLVWDKMKHLVLSLETTYELVKSDLMFFIEKHSI
ncbi:MAG: hypothetical protein FWG98_04335 [Candidatus Cloacimonetes bacterium]|nr:hypothetical protein [Candidatus Cloacimonadota bacterium]